MKSSHVLQNYWVVHSLPMLLEEGQVELFGQVVSSRQFKNFVKHCNPDLQEQLEKSLQQAIKKLDPSQLEKWLWPVVLCRAELLLGSEDAEWKGPTCPTVCECIQRMSSGAMNGDLLLKMMEWTMGLSPTVKRLRLLGCAALGLVTRKLGGSLDPDVIQHCLELCQDSDYAIRAEICSRWIPCAVKALDPKKFEALVLPELLELFNDDTPQVKQAVYHCVIDAMPFLRKDTLLSLVPHMQAVLQSGFAEMDREKCMTSLGPLAVKLRDSFGKPHSRRCPELQEMLTPLESVFVAGTTDSDEKVRLACCRNLPAIVSVFCTVRWDVQAATAVATLSKDSYMQVRSTLAAGFHHIVTCATGDPLRTAAQEAAQLLADDSSAEVRGGLLTELSAILSVLFLQQPTPIAEACAFCVNKIASQLGYSWRARQKMFDHLKKMLVVPCDHSPTIAHMVPILFSDLLDGAVELIPAASAALAACVSKASQKFERKGVFKRLQRDLAEASSSQHRIRFLIFCQHAARVWSVRLIRYSAIMEHALRLVGDPVARVREILAQMLPIVRPRLFEAQDQPLVERMLQVLNKLQQDDVACVVRAAGIAQAEIATQQDPASLEYLLEEEKALESAERFEGHEQPMSKYSGPEFEVCESEEQARDKAIELAMQDFIKDRNRGSKAPARPVHRRKFAKRNSVPHKPRTPPTQRPRPHRHSVNIPSEPRGINEFNKVKALPPIGSGSQSARLPAPSSPPSVAESTEPMPPRPPAQGPRPPGNLTGTAHASRLNGLHRAKNSRNASIPLSRTVPTHLPVGRGQPKTRKLPSLQNTPRINPDE